MTNRNTLTLAQALITLMMAALMTGIFSALHSGFTGLWRQRRASNWMRKGRYKPLI